MKSATIFAAEAGEFKTGEVRFANRELRRESREESFTLGAALSRTQLGLLSPLFAGDVRPLTDSLRE
jgi:hypothetical protein